MRIRALAIYLILGGCLAGGAEEYLYKTKAALDASLTIVDNRGLILVPETGIELEIKRLRLGETSLPFPLTLPLEFFEWETWKLQALGTHRRIFGERVQTGLVASELFRIISSIRGARIDGEICDLTGLRFRLQKFEVSGASNIGRPYRDFISLDQPTLITATYEVPKPRGRREKRTLSLELAEHSAERGSCGRWLSWQDDYFAPKYR